MPLCAVLNGILIGASGYAMYAVQPVEHPYAFTASALGFCHGVLGLMNSLKGEEAAEGEGDTCKAAKDISDSIMEIVPLPLVNIELYLANSETSGIALGHGLFIIPLVFDLLAKGYYEESEEESNTETLKDLTILGNVVSLVFLAVNESNYLFGSMAFTAFLTKYGAMLVETFSEGNGIYINLLGHSVFYILTAIALPAAAAETVAA